MRHAHRLRADAAVAARHRPARRKATVPSNRGEFEPKFPKAGQIPGARNAYWKGNLLRDGTFASPPVLCRRYLELGVREGVAVVVYCGSGISASHDLVALELAGLPGARLYAGSWSDWSARQDAPIELGDGSSRAALPPGAFAGRSAFRWLAARGGCRRGCRMVAVVVGTALVALATVAVPVPRSALAGSSGRTGAAALPVVLVRTR